MASMNSIEPFEVSQKIAKHKSSVATIQFSISTKRDLYNASVADATTNNLQDDERSDFSEIVEKQYLEQYSKKHIIDIE